jgi:YHS domain-containing protein
LGFLLRVALFLLLIAVVLRSAYRFLEGVIEGATGVGAAASRRQVAGHMVKDPVCGTYVVQGRALTAVRGQQTAWFCSPRCQQAWLQGKV